MAFDAKLHTVDPMTGYHVHKEDGRRVGDPAPVKRVSDDNEYPKWVEPHAGHISYHPIHGHPIASEWADLDVARNGAMKVLVHSEDDELRALADPREQTHGTE